MRLLTGVEAAREALIQLLEESKDYVVIGEGVPDPKACFGTTRDLGHSDRVFDSPISENGVTGICIGASLGGMKPIMIHMRQDFLPYAMDQIVNNAAKWHSMFGGQKSVPIVIKAFTGRGWGSGHQHSQNLEALFCHIPGLKVVSVSTAYNAKGLLIAAARDPNPVIILENRWTHPLTSEVPEEMYEVEIGKARVARAGDGATIVTWGFMVSEVLRKTQGPEVIDLQTIKPIDWKTIFESVEKTGELIVVSDAWKTCGVAAEIVARVSEECSLITVSRVTCPDYYVPSSHGISGIYYPFSVDKAGHDVPDKAFTGPF